jgi:hemolysin-activating ACP:hemolysin acyltransferase
MGIFGRKKNIPEENIAPANKATTSNTDSKEPRQITSSEQSPDLINKHQSRPALPIGTNDTFAAYGKITRILAISSDTHRLPIGQLEEIIMPALISGQIILAEAKPDKNVNAPPNSVIPLAFALWANVSKEIDNRLSENLDEPWRLSTADWRSGDIPWLIMVAGDQKAINQILKNFSTQSLSGKSLKMRVRGPDGKNILTTYPQQHAFEHN